MPQSSSPTPEPALASPDQPSAAADQPAGPTAPRAGAAPVAGPGGPARLGAAGRRVWWWAAAAVASVATMASSLFGSRVVAPGDGQTYYLPLHTLAAQLWRSGHIPTLNRFEFSGFPLLAIGQAGVVYPPDLIAIVLSAGLANNLLVTFMLAVAGVGAALFCRRLGADQVGAAVAGLAFGSCGYLYAHIGHQAIDAAIAWLPWALWGIEGLLQRRSVGRLLQASVPLGLAALAGHPQMYAQILMSVAVFALLRTATDPGLRRRLLGVGLLVAAVVCGTALGALQLLPTEAILSASDRSVVPYSTATQFSLPLSHVALLVFPYLFGSGVSAGPVTGGYHGTWGLTEMSGYVGAAALVLGAAALGRRAVKAWCLVGVAVVALLVALGPATPVGQLVYHLPVYGQFRNWARNVASVDVVVATLAGLGVTALRTRQRAAAVRSGVVAVLVVLAALVVTRLPRIEAYLGSPGTERFARLAPAAFALVASCCAVGLVLRGRLATRWLRGGLAAVLVLVVAFDGLVSFGWWYEWRAVSPSSAEVAAAQDPHAVPPYLNPMDAPGGIDRSFYVGQTLAVPTFYGRTDVQGVLSANGYDPLAPVDYDQSVGGMVYYGALFNPTNATAPVSHVLDLLRVTRLYSEPGAPVVPSVTAAYGPPTADASGVLSWTRTPAVPDAWVVGATRRAPAADAAAALRGAAPLSVTSEAVLEADCRGCALDAPGAAGTVTASRFGADDIRLTVHATRPGLALVSEAYYPGWQATVNGAGAPVVRADHLVLGVPVPAGDSTVVLRYRAPGLRAGAAVTGAAAVLLVGAAIAAAGRRHRARGAAVTARQARRRIRRRA